MLTLRLGPKSLMVNMTTQTQNVYCCILHQCCAIFYRHYTSSGLDIKDCLLARGNQIFLSGKQNSMYTCPTDNQIFCCFVAIGHIGQVKFSFGQPV
jgi:hypothetical protein